MDLIFIFITGMLLGAAIVVLINDYNSRKTSYERLQQWRARQGIKGGF